MNEDTKNENLNQLTAGTHTHTKIINETQTQMKNKNNNYLHFLISVFLFTSVGCAVSTISHFCVINL
jgi:hypothetical protein